MKAPTGTLSRFAGVAATVSLTLVALVGCTDPDRPGTLPSHTPKVSSSPATPTASTPEEEVEATMIAYFEAANEMFVSGEVEALRAFSTRGCSCRKITNSVEKVVMSGGRYEGAQYVVESIRVHDLDDDSALAEVKATVPPFKVFDGEGSLVEDSSGGTLHTDFSLLRRGEKWIVGNALNLE